MGSIDVVENAYFETFPVALYCFLFMINRINQNYLMGESGELKPGDIQSES